MNRIAVLLVACVVSGCAALHSSPTHHYYLLEAAPSGSTAHAKHDLVILVAPATVDGFYDTQDIVFSRSAGVRSYYQFSSWAEAPGRQVDALLTTRIDQDGAFRAVASAGEGIRGNLLLTTHLEEIYHDATQLPGSAHVTMSAELIDIGRRSLIGRRKFSASVPVLSPDAAGAAAACGQALGLVLDQVVAWTNEVAPNRDPS